LGSPQIVLKKLSLLLVYRERERIEKTIVTLYNIHKYNEREIERERAKTKNINKKIIYFNEVFKSPIKIYNF